MALLASTLLDSAEATTPTPSTWNLLAAGERTAIFPADVMQQSNLTLNNGSYFYNLSNFSSSYNRGSFGFSPNSTVTLDLADTRDGQFSTWGLCAEDNSGALRMSWNRTGASGENVTAGYRIGCSFNVAGIRAVYQSNSQPTYYPSGPQRNVVNSTLIAGGWTQCYIGDYQQTVAYSTITNACTEPYILLAGYVGSSTGPTVSTFSSSTTSPRNDSNASYSVVFSQSVTGLNTDDFENAGTATGCTFAVSGSGTTYTLTTSNCSDGTIQPRLKANSVTGSAFDGPTSAATASTTITIDRVAPTATASTVTVAAGSTGVIAVGSTGPGGGRVFYESSTGFACGPGLTETCHLLEAAPTSGASAWSDGSRNTVWSGNTNTATGATGTAIGTGYKNTLAIISQNNTSNRAASKAQSYRGPNNFSDWYLPSKDELIEMNSRKSDLSLVTDDYWSSSESSATNAWYYYMGSATWNRDTSKGDGLYVRAIRAFVRNHVVVSSSETGTAYLVNQSVTVTNVASITGAADNLQNSVSISSANTDTNLSTAGLTSGTYKLYTVDAAGNLSAASTNTITIKPAAPETPDLDAASDLGTSSTENNTADDTPTFTVSSLATGAVVTLTATPASGSPVTCSFTATSASGSCTFTAMPNGTYALTAVQVGSGISSDTSTALSNVVINKTTITAGTPDLADASDSGVNDSVNPFEAFGVSNSDDITNDNTPTINVSGSSSGTRTVTAAKAGSSVSCTLSSGAYTCGTAQSPLADGIWSITVTDTDSSGNSATSAALSVTIDTVPPAEFGGSYAERVTVPRGTNIQIQVPEAGSAQLRNTDRYTGVKSALIPIAQANTSYTVQVPPDYENQCYYLYAYDVAGNQRQSRNFVVCTAPAAAPTIGNEYAPSGTYKFGQTLTNQMTVTGVPTPTVTYQYLRCTDSSNLNTCQDISGATSSTYTLTADDLGFKIGIRVTATNSQGSDTHTATSGNTITADSPGAPTSVSATITGETTASVSFTAPTFNGGAAITDYDLEYSSNNGSNWTSFNNGTSTANPILVTGLTKNTSYIFRVKAKNTAGDGSFSTASSAQTTFLAPTVADNLGPSGTRTVGQTMTNRLTFSGVPTPTVSYQWLRCTSNSPTWVDSCVDIPNATATTYLLTDADYNHHMAVRATAVNSAGTLARSQQTSGVVSAVVPGVPTSVSATITGATTATVSFTAPTSTGGAAITGYTVTSNPSGAKCVVGVNATTYECTRLTPNTAYTFTVKATSSAGTGSSSQASSSVTTEAAPTLSVSKYDTNQNLRGPNDTPITIPSGWVSLTDPCSNHSQYFSYSFSLSDTCRSINESYWEVRSPNLVLNNGNSASLTLNFVNPVSSFIFDVAAVDNQSPNQVHMLVFYDDSNPESFYVGNSGFISHPITANGSASTRYQVSFPDSRPIKKIGLGFNSNGTGGTQDTIIFDNFSFVVTPLSATTSVSTKSLTSGTAATSFTPITASGGGSSKTYSISPSLPAGLSLNTSTGAITGTPSGASASTTYTVSVSAGSSTASATFTLGVNAALTSAAGSVPSGVYKDVAVTAFTPISFSGGASPISYAVSPSLPAGLTLNTSTGVISGTATGAAANTTYTVTATDANGDSEASTFAFAVTDSTTPSAPTIGAATSTSATTAVIEFLAPNLNGGSTITRYIVRAYSESGISTSLTGEVNQSGSGSALISGLSPNTKYKFKVEAINSVGPSAASEFSNQVTTAEDPSVVAARQAAAAEAARQAAAVQAEYERQAAAAEAARQAAAAEAARQAAAAEAARQAALAEAKALAEKMAAEEAARLAAEAKALADMKAAEEVARIAAEKVAAEAEAARLAELARLAAEKAAADKLKSDELAIAASIKAKTEVEAAIIAAKAAAEKAALAEAAKISAAAAALTAATQAMAAADAQAAADKTATAATTELKNASAAAAKKAATTKSTQKAVADAAAVVEALAKNAAALAATKAVEAKTVASAARKAASAAIERIAVEQKEAAAAAALAKVASDELVEATAEKISTATAAKIASETLLKALEEKAILADQAVKETDLTIRSEIDKRIEVLTVRITEAQRVSQEADSKAENAAAAQEEAARKVESTKADAQVQTAEAEEIKIEAAAKIAAASKASAASAVAAKIATAAKVAAAKVPSTAVISTQPSKLAKKNSATISIKGLKPGQKVKVTVNVRSKS